MRTSQLSSPAGDARGHFPAGRGPRKISGPLARLGIAMLLLALALAAPCPLSASAKEKKTKDGEPQPVTDTLIKVTTFTELGSTLRGAKVKLLPADKDGNVMKGKVLQGITNGMGEYPFHVPKAEAKYVLEAEAKGFESVSKPVHARGEDQTDIFLQLPAKK
ncbi:MAG: hypothetical protein KJZ70_11490 [Bryobacterales bacterium]|nr:hypothetical protein [Bryobacterales bacterium]